MVLIPALIGALATIGAGGMRLIGRIKLAAVTGIVAAAGYIGIHSALRLTIAARGADIGLWMLVKDGSWSLFIFTLLSVVSVILTEMLLPEPKNTME